MRLRSGVRLRTPSTDRSAPLKLVEPTDRHFPRGSGTLPRIALSRHHRELPYPTRAPDRISHRSPARTRAKPSTRHRLARRAEPRTGVVAHRSWTDATSTVVPSTLVRSTRPAAISARLTATCTPHPRARKTSDRSRRLKVPRVPRPPIARAQRTDRAIPDRSGRVRTRANDRDPTTRTTHESPVTAGFTRDIETSRVQRPAPSPCQNVSHSPSTNSLYRYFALLHSRP